MSKKLGLYDAQQIGWVTDHSRECAAMVAKNTARDQATLAYQNKYAEAYDAAFKAEFERSIYQTTMGEEIKAARYYKDIPF